MLVENKSRFNHNIFKVTPTTFWLKCINLSKCTKLSFRDKLEVADKYFGLLTRIYLIDWQIRRLKDDISGNILESLNSNFACVNRRTHVIFLLVGPLKSLPMIIK